MPHPELLLFFLVVAFVYASVGFGGGSSYLAILMLYGLPLAEMKLTALICNIIVVTGGTMLFIRQGQINWRKVLPLALVSVPMAYIGGRMPLKQDVFFIILGCSLLVASILLWIRQQKADGKLPSEKNTTIREMLIGAAIGFLSGLVGIGGGIFLSPVLNLVRWDTPKKIAATASVFILVNSISGIAGQLSNPPQHLDTMRIALLCGAVLIGGQLGSRMATLKFDHQVIRRMTALLVFVAGIEALHKHLHLFR